MCAAGITKVNTPSEIRSVAIALQVVVLTAPALASGTYPPNSDRVAIRLSLLSPFKRLTPDKPVFRKPELAI